MGVCDLFLSLTACKNIGLIPRNFQHNVIAHNHCIPNTGLSIDDMVLPSIPDTLPYPPTEQHILELEAWLLQKFSTTTFNISSDKLPHMSGKPHKIHLVDNALPFAAHTPIPIPHHWKDEVKRQLDEDVEKGILRNNNFSYYN